MFQAEKPETVHGAFSCTNNYTMHKYLHVAEMKENSLFSLLVILHTCCQILMLLLGLLIQYQSRLSWFPGPTWSFELGWFKEFANTRQNSSPLG